MFDFTQYKMTQAAQGGYLMRALTGDMIELHVGADDDLAHAVKPAVYPLGSILVDIHRDQIVFIDPDGDTVTMLDGTNGTKAILNNVVVQRDPDPHANKGTADSARQAGSCKRIRRQEQLCIGFVSSAESSVCQARR